MEKRSLGRTGHESTVITLGGAALRPSGFSMNGLPTSRREADEFIQLALDYGVNHVDVAPTYGRTSTRPKGLGDAEVILGQWVKEYRKDLFLACKTNQRTRHKAEEELHRSLKRLQTDYLDLYQLHGLDDPGELQTALSEEGAIRAMVEAKERDLLKYIGITSHNPVNIMKALNDFDFDTVLLPVNYVLHAHPQPLNDYEPVLDLAKKRNLGVIAMKSVARGPWSTEKRTHNCWYQPFESQEEVDAAVWFTLSQGVSTASSCSDIRIAKMMLNAAERYTPLDQEEQQMLVMKAATLQPLFPRIR